MNVLCQHYMYMYIPCTCTVMYTHVGTVSLAQDIVHVQVCMYEAVYDLHVHVYIILH